MSFQQIVAGLCVWVGLTKRFCSRMRSHVHGKFSPSLTLSLHPVLQAGDAVFIPEGWWHQIDSSDITIAVNFWWQSPFGAGLQVWPSSACTQC